MSSKEIDPRFRLPLALAAVVQVALTAAALLDLRKRTEDQLRGPKRLWTVASFVNFVGPIAYFTFGRRRP
ncbi:PLDc N-terminal domain-containing protein [Rhodococcus gannanensis]|uniref:PLDc N-terminal domain-containing protein n=1 Tax=Rhodococcus gannanensis TaxID=1960308 RepID=A0ABW4PA10_9NOCA